MKTLKSRTIRIIKKYRTPLIGLGSLILIGLIGETYMYSCIYYPVNKYGIYTVATVTNVKRTGVGVAPSCYYCFYYKGKKYEGEDATVLKKKDIGKRFYVHFLKESPNRCLMLADKSVPDCITKVPPEGWEVIPTCVSENGIYTVATVTNVESAGRREGTSCYYYFYYKEKKYEGRNVTNLTNKDIDKRFYVQFLEENPNRCGILADKPVPDCITEVPSEGWEAIPSMGKD
jgi:hypothetical protein